MSAAWSLNEIEALARKATRGAGYSWGQAEDAGRAVRWLEARGMPGAPALRNLLSSGGVAAPEQCPIRFGCAVSDGVFDDVETPEADLVAPLLMLPFVAWRAARQTAAMRVSCTGMHAGVNKAGEALEGEMNWPDRGVVQVTAHPVSGPIINEGYRAFVDCEVIVGLEAFAARTYAPATAASRESGAGAGLSDND